MATVRKDHDNQIERWALFIKENPTTWKKIHTEFINALFEKHEQFKARLEKTAEGKEKLAKLYESRDVLKKSNKKSC